MIIALTVCYNNFNVIEKSIDRYYEVCYYKPDIHFIIDNEYPLNKDRLKETLKKLSHKYNCIILEPNRNLGIKNGVNWTLDQISLSDNDKIIIYDSNAYPVTKHFDKALIDVLENNEDIVGACLTGGSHYTNKLEKLYDNYSKHYYFSETNFNMGSSIGIFNYYIHKQLKYDIDLYNNYYGDAINLPDSKLKKLLKNIDKKMIFLSEYNENLHFYTSQEDKDYVKYKMIAQISSLRDFNLEQYILNRNRYDRVSAINYKIKKINEVINF